MITIRFLAEWAVRSSVLILSGALLVGVLRVKDSSIRLAAWTAMLIGSMAIPAMTSALPVVPVRVLRPAVPLVAAPVVIEPTAPLTASAESRPVEDQPAPFDWARAGLILYALVASAMLLRLCVGLAMSRRLLRGSRATGQTSEGIEIRESDGVTAPVTLGIARPAIVLPVDWRQWDRGKLDAVLAHERSHIRRFDPAVQLLSAIHRALLWHSPLSWFLHSRIVRVAEEASDDAAVAVTQDRASYAELLLEFMQRGACHAGVPMARYGRADRRIHRILDGTVLSRGVTRRSLAAILLLGSPLAYVAATGQPQSATPAPAAAQPVRSATPSPAIAQAATPNAPKAAPKAASNNLTGLGNVAAATVTVRPRVEGQLMSLGYKEGELVQAGQVIATVEARGLRSQFEAAMVQLDRDHARLQDAKQKELPYDLAANVAKPLENQIAVDEDRLREFQRLLDEGSIKSPITGVAGLRLIEPGNMVNPNTDIVTIAQLEPVAVVFTLPQDFLPRVRARLNAGGNPAVEAWNRDNTIRIATGRLTAMDNQIDQTNGTVKLKATFDNKDGALFPNQFVNVRVLLGQ